jgi:hypothetical protein
MGYLLFLSQKMSILEHSLSIFEQFFVFQERDYSCAE